MGVVEATPQPADNRSRSYEGTVLSPAPRTLTGFVGRMPRAQSVETGVAELSGQRNHPILDARRQGLFSGVGHRRVAAERETDTNGDG